MLACAPLQACLGIVISCLRHIDEFMRPMVSSVFAKEVSSGICQYQPHMCTANIIPHYILHEFPGMAAQSTFATGEASSNQSPKGARLWPGRTSTHSRRIVAAPVALEQFTSHCRAFASMSSCRLERQMLCIRNHVYECHPSCVAFEFAHVCQATIDDSLCLHVRMSTGWKPRNI